ncbi:MAG: hypothetical protein JNK57_15710, partial [Planctomycetaceae bacterium]|nr:hypothetical protein [Planctomycetaceae bacterium]
MLNWRNMVKAFTVFVLLIWFAPSAVSGAQETSSPDGMLEVSRINGTKFRIPPTGVSAAGVQPTDGPEISWEEINELTTKNALLGDDPTATVVRLRGNGVLQVRSLTAADGLVSMSTDLAEIRYPLLDIHSIRFAKS